MTEQDKLSLAELSAILRDESRWPKGFQWYFRDCYQCAMGMAYQLWPDRIERPHDNFIAKAFGMTLDDTVELFLRANSPAIPSNTYTIEPHHIADAIDYYLANPRLV